MLHQGDCDDQIAPTSSISWMCCHTSSTKDGAIHQSPSLNGLLLVTSMMFSVASVHPFLFGL